MRQSANPEVHACSNFESLRLGRTRLARVRHGELTGTERGVLEIIVVPEIASMRGQSG
jgi:hypothetical protein